MKVYLVTFNGWRCGYGAIIYLVGVYDELSKAKETVNKITSNTQLTEDDINIDELEMNVDHKVKEDAFGRAEYTDGSVDISYKTDLSLGGYCE